MSHLDSFHCKTTLTVGQKKYTYFSLPLAEKNGLKGIHQLPFPQKILLENLLRHEDGKTVKKSDIEAFVTWLTQKTSDQEIAYHPARVLMQDFTGVPAVVDLAAMRDAMQTLQKDPKKVNPLCPVDLVIDHSVQVDHWQNGRALSENVEIEMQRNRERYEFLRWGQQAFQNFRVVPPGTGICHQVNLEYLSKVVWTKTENGETYAYPDTVVGTDSHTTMVNGLSVLAWGVGGIEAEAAMLGQPISMLIPETIGMELTGEFKEGVTATDLVLTVTNLLRKKGVVGKFVQFYGAGVKTLPVADRATLGNMSPEYGATCGIFPVDAETIAYLKLSNRDAETIALVEAYARAQEWWYDEKSKTPIFTDTLSLNLDDVVPCIAGPKRPQDLVPLPSVPKTNRDAILAANANISNLNESFEKHGITVKHGDVVIAAITSCTNTSNPSVMLAAGLVAQKALEKGLKIKAQVKASLAPGSKVVTDYLKKAGLLEPLNNLGFSLVGYGCTTCIGNSGPLGDPVSECIVQNNLDVSSVLSGNRNFEGRIHPLVKSNWLASPPLVVAYALAGSTLCDLTKDALGMDQNGKPVYLKDVWPTNAEIAKAKYCVEKEMFHKEYSEVFQGDATWQKMATSEGLTYDWQEKSTYVRRPPFFELPYAAERKNADVKNARILAIFGDSITTDHISPAGSIKKDSPAGKYLLEHGVQQSDFNSYGARRGNHEVMMRGTFANIRIRNEMVPGVEGGMTKLYPDETILPIYDAAMQYQQTQTPLVVFAGKEYGSGSSRDWAAKGPRLLGVTAVIAESFERIHRSNLIGMGILPLVFVNGTNRLGLKLRGDEKISLSGLEHGVKPKISVQMQVERITGEILSIPLLLRIDTQDEAEYFTQGGILNYVLKKLA